MGAVNAAEIKQGIRASYDYYFAKLPKKTQAVLAAKPKRGFVRGRSA
jgi:predicted DNA-binding protein (MmcQ/YjbR family)